MPSDNNPAQTIAFVGARRPATISLPPETAYRGNLALLEEPLTALFCSNRCPGDVILKIYDLARAMRDNAVPVIGGFQTPMEKECLRLLLRGEQPVVLCPARGIQNMRVPRDWRASLSDGRMLILSLFPSTYKRPTAKLAAQRNDLAAALARRVFIAHAACDGKTEAFARRLAGIGKPLLTLSSPANSNLLEIGAKIVVVEATGKLCPEKGGLSCQRLRAKLLAPPPGGTPSMIQLSQRHRAGLQFLGSLQHYSSSRIRDVARQQFAASEQGRKLMEAEIEQEPRAQLERAEQARAAALECPAFQHERLYQRYVAEENFVRAIPAVEEKREEFLQELNRNCDYQGGSLELDRKLPIPEYYEGVEWHLEPGGWDGYDLAGPMFMAGVAPYVFIRGGYAAVEVGQDIRRQRADVVSLLPKDHYGRIYEPGCGGLGALAACHHVYPNAELIGSDLSTALLKGGHRAARNMRIPIHLKQRDARYTGEPDASFDAVVLYALLHEMPVEVSIDTIREAYRILKPGGDIVINDPPPFSRVDAFQAAILDWETEYRGEPFFSVACSMDWSTVLTEIGFEMLEARALDPLGYPWVNVATKPTA